MAAQFVPGVAAAALPFQFPRVPLTQVAERQGSGKLTLNKSGASGTRVWQCPWFLHPAFCDFLLGRAAVNPFGRPQLWRPDVFHPCYPWLYCQEASVEGEDLLGVDGAMRAFYRRAIVTAKYMPLEMNNSIHINSQMLTIPNTQFIFIGQNPNDLVGFKQIFSVEFAGTKPNSGTFRLGFANDAAAGSFTIPAITPGSTAGIAAPTPPEVGVKWTGDIPCNASQATVLLAARRALGLTLTAEPGAVLVTGPEGKPGAFGPWFITISMPEVKTLYGDGQKLVTPTNGLFINKGGHTRGIDAIVNHGGTKMNMDDWWLRFYNPTESDHTGVSHREIFSLEWSARYKAGSFRFLVRATGEAGTGHVNYSDPVNAATATPLDIYLALRSATTGFKKSPPADKNLEIEDRTVTGEGFPSTPRPFGKLDAKDVVYLSWLYRDGAAMPTKRFDTPARLHAPIFEGSLSQMATGDAARPLIMYFGFQKLTRRVTSVDIEWVDGSAVIEHEQPTVKVQKFDPYLANRLDQNVGKVVPMGEITFQRHQVIATDMVYLLSVVGCVNMFTFMGFPPWTLLLSGIEAKQTRLPNGTPCYDMTFKFAFNPYTHQAIFRPAYMRWEFVRGVLVSRLPKSVAVPTSPLDLATGGRAKLNKLAIAKAFNDPKPPRVVPLVINPLTGAVVPSGAKGVVGNVPAAAPKPAPPPNFNPSETKLGQAGRAGDVAAPNPAEPDASLGAGPINTPPSGNVNPNPPANSAPATTGSVAGGIESLFGTVDALSASAQQGLLGIMQALSRPLIADPNARTSDPLGAWASNSNTLGDMIAKSVGIANAGTANDDTDALNSGVAADIEAGRKEGAAWLDTLDNGVSSTDEDATGNLSQDLAYARAAHECGAKLAPKTRELLGLPPDTDAMAHERALTGIGGNLVNIIGQVTQAATNVMPAIQNAANVGAAKSVQGMATRIFDLGLIYPICDYTPILFMQ